MTALEIFRGDSPTYEITVTDENDAVVNISGAELVFSVKAKITDSTYTFQRKNAAAGGDATQIEMSDPTNGIFRLFLTNTNTQNLQLVDYVYDIEMILASKVYTLCKGSFIVLGDVTR